jgi:hypothetical protein
MTLHTNKDSATGYQAANDAPAAASVRSATATSLSPSVFQVTTRNGMSLQIGINTQKIRYQKACDEKLCRQKEQEQDELQKASNGGESVSKRFE